MLRRLVSVYVYNAIMTNYMYSWEEMAKNILRAEMTRHGVSYAVLADRLGALGVTDNELNLRNKVSRGRFTAVFFLQCLKALDAEWIHLPASLDVAHVIPPHKAEDINY